jgi:hypothetical protein
MQNNGESMKREGGEYLAVSQLELFRIKDSMLLCFSGKLILPQKH